MKRRLAFLPIAVLIGLVCACGSTEAPYSEPEDAYPKQSVELVAPAGTGSGYDLTIRSVAQCLQDTGLVTVPLPITNKPGGGGGVALSYLSDNQGSDGILSVFSAPICLIHLNGSTALSYDKDTTPIAKLITDYGCFAVDAASPYETIGQVMQVLREDPKAVRIGGTSAVGSMDHIQFLKVAQAAQVEQLSEISYMGFEDGTAAAQLMGGHIDVISTGISDVVGLVESGDLRVLAITAEKRVGSGIVAQMPTCIEQGIDATFRNWRGLFGPKKMPDDALAFWEDTLAQLVQTQEWQETCAKYGWDMDYQGHEEFNDFLAEVNQEYKELLTQTGLLKTEP